MTYVLSDIHGQYEQYRRMLETIAFSDSDTLYVLGDSIDRGPEPVRVLTDMSLRSNVVPILGNHELMAYRLLRTLCVEITEQNAESQIDARTLEGLALWQMDGGQTTLDGFRRLPHEEQLALLDYIAEHAPYEVLTVGGERFVLVHGGVKYAQRHLPLSEQDLRDLVTERPDYTKRYFPRAHLVTGHTPTGLISPDHAGRIYRANGHIAVDCGAVFGGRLGCLRLEDMAEYYV